MFPMLGQVRELSPKRKGKSERQRQKIPKKTIFFEGMVFAIRRK
jgi:hypothetical protein